MSDLMYFIDEELTEKPGAIDAKHVFGKINFSVLKLLGNFLLKLLACFILNRVESTFIMNINISFLVELLHEFWGLGRWPFRGQGRGKCSQNSHLSIISILHTILFLQDTFLLSSPLGTIVLQRDLSV
jgi:hypothetical protein